MVNESDYTFEYTADHQPLWRKNGHRVKRTQVPKEIQLKLEPQEPKAPETVDAPVVEPANLKPERPVYDCLMCDKQATRTRFVNLQIVHVCEEHYFNCTLGSLVIKLRERGQYEPVLPTH